MNDAECAAYLCSAAAVRDHCTTILGVAETTGLTHFTVHPEHLAATADFTAGIIRQNYPDLAIPHHARWRHFSAGGVDRWAMLAAAIGGSMVELARIRVELCVTSVLLDAGAGPAWRYRDPATGLFIGRSEGLGVASFDAFRRGVFSTDGSPRVDAEALLALDTSALAAAFQITPENPLLGMEGRAALLRSLGAAILRRPDIFKGDRLGGLFDTVTAAGDPIQAPTILAFVLECLGPIWPSRLTMAGRPLGDTWPHPAIAGDGLVPFHKLSQWLTYSLIEVFEDSGHVVHAIDDLTGLPEYRNGGLFLDCGVIRPRDQTLYHQPLTAAHEAVVEWRALTVALLDRLATLIRQRLDRDADTLPLSRILEGGTWAAGRAIAGQRRLGGAPPLNIQSDGTVF
jgi:hypothetical protein